MIVPGWFIFLLPEWLSRQSWLLPDYLALFTVLSSIILEGALASAGLKLLLLFLSAHPDLFLLPFLHIFWVPSHCPACLPSFQSTRKPGSRPLEIFVKRRHLFKQNKQRKKKKQHPKTKTRWLGLVCCFSIHCVHACAHLCPGVSGGTFTCAAVFVYEDDRRGCVGQNPALRHHPTSTSAQALRTVRTAPVSSENQA